MTSSPPHGIDRQPIKIVVLAGNFREFKHWCDSREMNPREVFFASSAQVLRGRSWSTDTSFMIVGTFSSRPDAQEIMGIIRVQIPEVHFHEA